MVAALTSVVWRNHTRSLFGCLCFGNKTTADIPAVKFSGLAGGGSQCSFTRAFLVFLLLVDSISHDFISLLASILCLTYFTFPYFSQIFCYMSLHPSFFKLAQLHFEVISSFSKALFQFLDHDLIPF